MRAIEKVEQISTDFNEGNEPFDDVEFPEERLLDTLDLDTPEDRLRAVSLFSTLDYNRNAGQLVDKILELRDSRLLEPEYVADNPEQVREAFVDVAFRYKNRDADAWIENCSIITNEYHGLWSNLLLETGCDAPQLVKRLNKDGFLCIKGVKIAPMYARIINDNVFTLDNIWELEIPVDTHIRRLSKDLFNAPDKDDAWIRREWRGVSCSTDISPHIVDGALWHIGNKWNDWGEEYWKGL
jgi:hypothetical protein